MKKQLILILLLSAFPLSGMAMVDLEMDVDRGGNFDPGIHLQPDPILAEDGKDYYGAINLHRLKNSDLRDALFEILESHHISSPKGADKIVNSCDLEEDRCYRHRRMGYKNARKFLFGHLHLQGSSQKNYSITSFYCRDQIKNQHIVKGAKLGPMQIPDSTVINAEHSWPQSRFNKSFSTSLQKSDLHSLFPVHSRVNSQRGNRPYGRVDKPTQNVCREAFYGKNSNQAPQWDAVFEPSKEIKGDIARALFYFAVRYKSKIDPMQEHFLRLWHGQDPVDDKETLRNDEIYSIQYKRNPFVDFPELVDQIEDF